MDTFSMAIHVLGPLGGTAFEIYLSLGLVAKLTKVGTRWSSVSVSVILVDLAMSMMSCQIPGHCAVWST